MSGFPGAVRTLGYGGSLAATRARPAVIPQSVQRIPMPGLQSRHAARRHHGVAVLLLALVASACAGSGHVSMQPRLTPISVAFENAMLDPVTVYIDDGGSQWRLGHIEPGRRARLRLPDDVANRFEDLVLVAVPLGAHRDSAHGEFSGAIRSEVEPPPKLVALRWTLREGKLVGAVSPAGRR